MLVKWRGLGGGWIHNCRDQAEVKDQKAVRTWMELEAVPTDGITDGVYKIG